MYLLWALVAAVVLSGLGQADSFRPEYFVNGTVDLASAFSRRGLPEVNTMRRGDSPFDNLKVTLFGDVIVHPRLQILNQIILDPSSGSSVASFLRTYARVTVTEAPERSLSFEAGKIPTPLEDMAGALIRTVIPSSPYL